MAELTSKAAIATKFLNLLARSDESGLLAMIRDYDLDHERSIFNVASYRHSDEESIYASFIIKMTDCNENDRFICIDKTCPVDNMYDDGHIVVYEVVAGDTPDVWLPRNDERLKLR